MKKILSFILAVVLMLTVFGGCAAQPPVEKTEAPITDAPQQTVAAEPTPKDTSMVITDVLGREVTLEEPVEKIVAIGANTLRIVCYLDATDMVVGVEDFEINPAMISAYRPYAIAYPEIASQPVIAVANGAVDVEALLVQDPDVILCAYSDVSDADTLQEQTGIPVISVRYSMGVFGEDFFNALSILGETLGHQEDATNLINAINAYMEDLNNRTKDVADDTKPSVYVGGENFNGWHGIDGTNSAYVPFEAINALNVAKSESQASAYLVDMEQILVWNPEIIFLNYENMGLVNDQYVSNPDFFESLDAVKNDKVYKVLPYVWYGTNAEMAIVDAYYIGTLLYPEQFADIDLEAKINEIFQTFLRCDLYEACETAIGGFGTVKIGE